MNGSPVTGAMIKASVFQAKNRNRLLRRRQTRRRRGGRRHLRRATEKLAAGDYVVEARAETNGQIRIASAAVEIGSANK
jgi:hypothetical protein